jgi:hypothetical protein
MREIVKKAVQHITNVREIYYEFGLKDSGHGKYFDSVLRDSHELAELEVIEYRLHGLNDLSKDRAQDERMPRAWRTCLKSRSCGSH